MEAFEALSPQASGRAARVNGALIAAGFVLLSGTAFGLALHARTTATNAAHPILAAAAHTGARGDSLTVAPQIHAVMVLRMGDCAARLEVIERLHALVKSHVAPEKISAVIMDPDRAAASDSLTQRALDQIADRLQFRFTAGRTLERQLHALGHRLTPLLVLYDRQDRVRAIVPPDQITSLAIAAAARLALTE
jgi:hypothetical protein